LATTANLDFKQPQARVERHSAALRKDLGLTDLVLARVLMVVVPEFLGTAVKAGSAQVAM
jgi:hypothetical protein